MEILRTLWWADSISATRWFTTKHLSRLIIAILFLAVFCTVTYGVWAISNAFFRSIAGYEQFGKMTAEYIIHAAIIVILWLALGSSVVSYVGLLLSSSPSLSYLLSLPVSPKTLNIWLFTKAVMANFILMAFTFVPIAAAYSNAFGVWNIFFLIRILLMLLCIVLVSSGIGMVVGLVSVIRLRGREYPAAIAGLVVFVLIMMGIVHLIFPPELALIYDAPSAKFLTLFSSLPLNNPVLPTAWMTQTVTGGFSLPTLFVLGMTAAVVIVCLKFQQTRLVPIFLRMRSSAQTGNISPAGFRALGNTNVPLVLKDWFSIIRLPSETGYGLFLGSMAVFFFLFLSFDVRHYLHQETWRIQLTVFTFAWIAFFATALFLRFLFPLVAREGKSAWYLFTLPITRRRILSAKILLSILFSMPVMVFSGLVWYLLPFVRDSHNQLNYISMVVIFTLALSQVLLGAVLPNFSQGSNTEKVSTSGMGLVALLVSGFVAALAAQWIGHMMSGSAEKVYFSVIPLGSSIIFLLILWFVTQEFIKRWEW